MPPKKVAAAKTAAPKKTTSTNASEAKKPAAKAASATASTTKKAPPKVANSSTKATPAKTAPKKATAKTAASKTTVAKAPAKASKAAPVQSAPAKDTTTSTGKKRKSPTSDEESESSVESDQPKEKKQKIDTDTSTKTPTSPKPLKSKPTPKPKPTPKTKAVRSVPAKPKNIINYPPADRLKVFVCGENGNGELGLGAVGKVKDVKRPRLNPLLPSDEVGVVQIGVGGMHCVALTHDNKLYTWGVNDSGALGRDTTWDAPLVDADTDDMNADDDASSKDSEEETGLNPRESTPTEIPASAFPPETIFVEVAATDSASFALTDDGYVWGWGTFRVNDGILGFSKTSGIQRTPTLVEGLKKIKHIVCGDNHVLALDDKGAVFAWGSGQQNQLGRRIIERTRMNGTQPREFGLPKGIKVIGCGAYHSFAVDKNNKVYAWGLNNFGETGVEDKTRRQVDNEEEPVIFQPEVIDTLIGKEVTCIQGGSHHSIAVTKDRECLVWGRIDGSQMGIKKDSLPKDLVLTDDRGDARILVRPTAVPDLETVYAAAGPDHCIAINSEGRAYSWGFNANYQLGQGTDDDVEMATLIDNTATRNEKLNWAGSRGQFSVFTSIAK